MSPSQWKGAVPVSPPRRAWVRRGPMGSKFQTWPSSPPSGWHDAQARKAPALEWKSLCPVS